MRLLSSTPQDAYADCLTLGYEATFNVRTPVSTCTLGKTHLPNGTGTSLPKLAQLHRDAPISFDIANAGQHDIRRAMAEYSEAGRTTEWENLLECMRNFPAYPGEDQFPKPTEKPVYEEATLWAGFMSVLVMNFFQSSTDIVQAYDAFDNLYKPLPEIAQSAARWSLRSLRDAYLKQATEWIGDKK